MWHMPHPHIVSSVHSKGEARLAECTPAAGIHLYTEDGRTVLGTVLHLFTKYHLPRHIPILLISNLFLQGYLSTWRGVRDS